MKKSTSAFLAIAALAAGLGIGAKGTRDTVATSEQATAGYVASPALTEGAPIKLERAHGQFEVIRNGVVVDSWDAYNVKTTAGIDYLFAQGYGTSAAANGLNYIGCSNDTLTETTASTTLSTEIAANGFTRAQGTYAHTAGTSTATISKTFTATGAQSLQKCALFSASSGGTMNHALSFTQRSLQSGDQLAVTFTITLS